MQLLKTSNGPLHSGFRLSTRCPACGRAGTFDVYETAQQDLRVLIDGGSEYLVGHRRCPASDCRLYVSFIASMAQGSELLSICPAETLDFDATSVPAAVVDALKEAILCHANGCYTAAAIMVRRTIEEMCHEQKAGGANLYDRIEALAAGIVLPKPFRDGLHDVRLLGNDAAHIEARTYGTVGEEEVRAGINVAKHLLQAVYQYDDLMAELGKLKRET